MTDSSQPLSRGVSEAVSYLLLLTIIILGVALIIYLGGGAISDLRDDVTTSQVDSAFADFDQTVTSVALAHPDAQSEYSLGLAQSGSVSFSDAGHITMGIDKTNDSHIDREALNTPLRTVTYEQEEYEVVYQGGAAFSQDLSEANRNLVSGPSLRMHDMGEQCDRYQTHPFLVPCQEVNDPATAETTLAFSVITLDQFSEVGDTMYILQTRETETEMLDKMDSDDRFIIEITSEYHEEWEKYALDNIEHAEVEETIDPNTARIVIDADEDISIHIVHATIGLQ